jgi:hypothetical protein
MEIAFISKDGTITGYILNPKQNHVCDDKAGVALFANGDRKFFDKVEDLNQFEQDFYEGNIELESPITGGSVACSICKSACIDEFNYLDI